MYESFGRHRVLAAAIALLMASAPIGFAVAQEGPAKPESQALEFWKPSEAISKAERERAKKLESLDAQEEIPDTAHDIAPLLAKHPDSSVIICIAGCGPQPSIVEVVANSDVVKIGEEGEMQQNSTDAKGIAPVAGAVVCIAGCLGKRGDVLYKKTRLSWLGDENSEKMKAALRAIADRLGAGTASSPTASVAQHISDQIALHWPAAIALNIRPSLGE